LKPLTDVEAALVLNRDSLIRRAWRNWSIASKNQGRVIVLDSARVSRILDTDGPDHDDVMGLA
jgi:hypothetical protein